MKIQDNEADTRGCDNTYDRRIRSERERYYANDGHEFNECGVNKYGIDFDKGYNP